MKDIFWIASYPKSGSTWMRLMLSAYLEGRCDINRIMGSQGDTDGYPLQCVAPRPASELHLVERLALRPAQLLHMAEASTMRPVVVKTHHLNQRLEGFDTIPPALTLGAVYIVRDPRDVAVSYAEHMGLSLDAAIANMAHPDSTLKDKDSIDPKTVLRSWSEHVESWVGDNAFPVNVIPYEEMLKDPKWALGAFLDAMGLKINGIRLERAVEQTRFEKIKAQEQASGFVEKSPKSDAFFKRGKSGGWRAILTEKQSAKIEADHAAMMKQLGYISSEAA